MTKTVAVATSGTRDAATSLQKQIAAAATAGQSRNASETVNRSPRTCLQPSRCEYPGSKERLRTAGNQKKSTVPVFLHRPGSWRRCQRSATHALCESVRPQLILNTSFNHAVDKKRHVGS